MNIDAELAMLAEAVYLPEWADVEAFIAPEWQLAFPLETDGSEAMVCRRGGDYVSLTFRGTQFSEGKLSDILANFGSWTLWEGPGSIHAGYHGYVTPIYAAAKTAMKRLAGARALVNGHSLGGAAAHNYAARIAFDPDGHHIDAVVSYGAPKIFNSESADCIPYPLRRYVMRNDFAPKWPLNPWTRQPEGPPLVLSPPRPRMSPFEQHWIQTYRTALASSPVTA